MRRPTRTTVAVLLTALTVAVPCGAWYVAGSGDARREAARLRAAPAREAASTAAHLAERAALRLESLRQAESRRPFSHYTSDETKQLRCPCALEQISPLAKALGDPLVRAHFQIDEVGRLVVPSVLHHEGAGRDAAGEPWLAEQQITFEALECVATAGAAPGTQEKLAAAAASDGVTLGALRWQNVSIEGRPELVAVRQVSKPDAVLTQGFVVSREELEATLDGGPYAARFVRGPADGGAAAAVPLESVDWHVSLDVAQAQAAADREAGAVLARFHRTFAVGLLAALFAGTCLVGLVWQTERLARQRARFAAAAAHELRTPLSGMRMYGEMLAEGLGDPQRSADYSRRIAEESARLGRVVDNVLGYARLEQGRFPASPQVGDLAAVVQSVLDQIRPTMREAGVELELLAEPELPPVRFDRDAVAQILHNLLDNAEKYTRNGEPRRLRVGLRRVSRGVELAVSDDGPGVPAALQSRLFRPFSRGGDADAPAGLGLGLAMVKALADAQHASVAYRSGERGGATFSVRFAG